MRAPAIILGLAAAAGLLTSAAHGATLGLDANATAESPGSVRVPVTLAVEPGEAIAGLQFDLLFDAAPLQFTGVETGAAAAAAEKTAHSNQIQPGQLRVVVAGFNRNAIASGETVWVVFSRPPALGDETVSLRMADAVLSDPFGSPVGVRITPDTLILDHGKAVALGTHAGGSAKPVSALDAVANYRAILFAVIAVGIAMMLTRKAPKKGRRH